MSTILNTISDFFERDLCNSDDCLNAPKPGEGGTAPLFEIAIGKWLMSDFHYWKYFYETGLSSN